MKNIYNQPRIFIDPLHTFTVPFPIPYTRQKTHSQFIINEFPYFHRCKVKAPLIYQEDFIKTELGNTTLPNKTQGTRLTILSPRIPL